VSWFRTRSGRLIHAVGGLAEVHVARGAVEVSDEDALAEIDSGVAQTKADVEGELAATVDEIVRKADEAKALRAQQKTTTTSTDGPPPAEFRVTTGTPPLTAEDQAAVDKAIDEESPR
jgi:hypothetical protein